MHIVEHSDLGATYSKCHNLLIIVDLLGNAGCSKDGAGWVRCSNPKLFRPLSIVVIGSITSFNCLFQEGFQVLNVDSFARTLSVRDKIEALQHKLLLNFILTITVFQLLPIDGLATSSSWSWVTTLYPETLSTHYPTILSRNPCKLIHQKSVSYDLTKWEQLESTFKVSSLHCWLLICAEVVLTMLLDMADAQQMKSIRVEVILEV